MENANEMPNIEEFPKLPGERQQLVLELIEELKDKHPEALDTLGPDFKVVTTDEYEQAEPDIEEIAEETGNIKNREPQRPH